MAIDPTLAFGTLAVGTRTNSTIPKPASTVDGDFLLGVLHTAANISVSLPAGWTLIVNDVDPADRVARTVVAYKRASGEGANWTWTHSSDDTSGFVWRLTGVVAAGNPEDATRSIARFDAPTFTWSSITTATANSLVVGLLSRRSITSTASGTTMTERLDMGCLMVQAAVQAGAGATGTKTCDETDYNDATLILLALKEATGGSDTPLTVTEGTLTLTGQVVDLNNTAMTVQEGTLLLSGQDVAMQAGASLTLPVTEATLSLPGQDVFAIYEIVWTEGALTLTGQNVAFILQQSEILAVTEGAISLTGQAVTLAIQGDTPVAVTEGILTLAGQDVTFAIGAGSVLVDVITAILTLGGQSVDLNPSFTLAASGVAKRENQRRHALFGLMNKGT